VFDFDRIANRTGTVAPDSETSIGKHAVSGCIEQVVKETSVRPTVVRADSYDDAMNLTLKPFDFAQAVARAGLATNGQPLDKSKAVQGPGFQQALTNALGAVSKSQTDAANLQREVQLDNPTVSLEQTMVAMQKAQIGFQATLTVRNKLVQAYSDIMQMQV
jgi:flagellar hook-basal body complex protein FliE